MSTIFHLLAEMWPIFLGVPPPPLSGTGQFQTLGGYILSQSLEEGTLKKASHPPTLKAPGAWPPWIMTEHVPHTPAFSRGINQGRLPWTESPPGGLRTWGERTTPQLKLYPSLLQARLQSSGRLWASSYVHLPGEGVVHALGRGHQLRRAIFINTVCLVSEVHCSWRGVLERGKPAASKPEAALSDVAPLMG